MASLQEVDFDPFKASPMDLALSAEGVDPKIAGIARSIYMQESGGGKNTKTSNAGAVGGMQIIPSTFKSVADKDWDIGDPVQNARAGVRYISKLYEQAGGDPALTAAGYYGGPGGLEKARRGVAVSDPRNPNAPTTLQYGQQVAARIPQEKGLIQRGVEAMIPSAQAEERPSAGPRLQEVDYDPFAAPGSKTFGQRMGDAGRGVANLAAGGVRGAGSIGATLLAPYDMAMDAIDGKGLSLESNRARRAGIDGGLQEMGADPNSFQYKTGKIGAEIAGTAGVGGALAKPIQMAANTRYASGMEPILNGAAKALQTGGFRVGEMAGTGAGTAMRIGGGALTGGAAAGLVSPEDTGTGAMIGGALPGAAYVAGKAGGAIRNALTGSGVTPEVAQLANRAAELGINIPADRLVNSRPLNAVAAGLNYVPMSGRAATEDAMSSQLNKALSKTFGQDSSNVTQALRKADDALGGQFDNFLRNNTLKVDKQFMADLADAGNQASRELSGDGAGIIGRQIDDILAKAGTGEIDGQAAYNIKKTLDRIGQRNSPEAHYALDLKGKLMDALNRSVGPEKASEFANVRKQYGSMIELQKLAKNGVDGEISVARMANMKNIRNPEMQELADIAAQFVKPREGQHGGAQRALVGLGAGLTGGPVGLLGGMAVGRGANTILNSNIARNALMRPQGLLGEPEALGLLTQGAYRTAPLLSSQ